MGAPLKISGCDGNYEVFKFTIVERYPPCGRFQFGFELRPVWNGVLVYNSYFAP
jgi:hypothetical protein